MNALKGFSSSVSEQLKHYVYRLIDPRNGNTFYVGKGKGDRVFAHVADALKDYNGENYIDKDEDDVSLKVKTIREIILSGLDVIHVIHRYGLTAKEAFEVEAALIDCYLGMGLTNIQSGHSSDRGVNSAEALERNLSLKEYVDDDNLKYCIIKIRKSYIEENNGDVYETVRKYWKVNLNRISKIPYVFASCDGVVLKVYEVDKWYKSSAIPDRCMFDGKETTDKTLIDRFVNKRIPQNYAKKGMASPVLYHDKDTILTKSLGDWNCFLLIKT